MISRSGSCEVDRAFGRRARGSEFGWIGRQAKVVEDLSDGGRVVDERQQSASSAAVGADECVPQEHSLEKLGPEVVPSATRDLVRGVWDTAELRSGCGALVSGYGRRRTFWREVARSGWISTLVRTPRQPLGSCVRRRSSRRHRHDAAAVCRRGREHAEVVDELSCPAHSRMRSQEDGCRSAPD